MFLRMASALVMIPITLAVVFFAPPAYYLVALGVVGSICLYEYFQLVQKMGLRGQPWFGFAGFWAMIAGLWSARVQASTLVTGICIAAFLAAMARKDPMRDRVLGMMANLLGILYLAFCLYPAFAVRFEYGDRLGLEWTLTLLLVIWTGDTAAYLGGRTFGRTPFAAQLSPKKTNEGALSGLVAGVVLALLLRNFFFADLPMKHVVVTSLLVGAFGQLGDLAESMLKRAAQVKESSNLIPGHGGVLDRVDSLLFAFPVLYLYLQQVYAA